MTGLTKAQRALLEEIESKSAVYVVNTYKPMIRLVDLGFATFKPGRFNHGNVRITPAGRSALSQEGE